MEVSPRNKWTSSEFSLPRGGTNVYWSTLPCLGMGKGWCSCVCGGGVRLGCGGGPFLSVVSFEYEVMRKPGLPGTVGAFGSFLIVDS